MTAKRFGAARAVRRCTPVGSCHLRMKLDVFTAGTTTTSPPPPRFADVLAAQLPHGVSADAVKDEFVVYDSSRRAYPLVDVVTASSSSAAAETAASDASQNDARTAPPTRATLVLWPRHFGCALCRRNIADIAAHHEQFVAQRQWRVVVIGNGTPEQAADFARDASLRIPPAMRVYTDPLRRTYLALNFRRGVFSMLHGRALLHVLRAFASGTRQRWDLVPTDAFQQGGCALIGHGDDGGGGGGELLMLQRSEYAGDTMSADDLLRLSW